MPSCINGVNVDLNAIFTRAEQSKNDDSKILLKSSGASRHCGFWRKGVIWNSTFKDTTKNIIAALRKEYRDASGLCNDKLEQIIKDNCMEKNGGYKKLTVRDVKIINLKVEKLREYQNEFKNIPNEVTRTLNSMKENNPEGGEIFEEKTFHDYIQNNFGECKKKEGVKERVSPLYINALEYCLARTINAEYKEKPNMTLNDVFGPNSTIKLFKDICDKVKGNSLVECLLKIVSMKSTSVNAYLRASKMFATGDLSLSNESIDSKLADSADKLADMMKNDPEKFTPYNVFTAVFDEALWPQKVPKNKEELTKDDICKIGEAVQRTDVYMEKAPEGLEIAYVKAHSLGLGLGLDNCEINKILNNPACVQDLFKTQDSRLISGVQKINAGVINAADQVYRDAYRMKPDIEISCLDGSKWKLPDVMRSDYLHPLRKVGQALLMSKIDEICGSGATDLMKANLYLGMTQNSSFLMVLTMLGCIIGEKPDSSEQRSMTNSISYSLSQNSDGSISLKLASREKKGVNVSGSMTMRYYLDGSQKIEEPLKVSVKPEGKRLNKEELMACREKYEKEARENANTDLIARYKCDSLGMTNAIVAGLKDSFERELLKQMPEEMKEKITANNISLEKPYDSILSSVLIKHIRGNDMTEFLGMKPADPAETEIAKNSGMKSADVARLKIAKIIGDIKESCINEFNNAMSKE